MGSGLFTIAIALCSLVQTMGQAQVIPTSSADEGNDEATADQDQGIEWSQSGGWDDAIVVLKHPNPIAGKSEERGIYEAAYEDRHGMTAAASIAALEALYNGRPSEDDEEVD